MNRPRSPRQGTLQPVPVYLAYGRDDRFAYGADLLAAVLPPSRVFTMPGGHDWPQWRPLWRRMVEAVLLPRGCTSAGSVPQTPP